MKKIRYFPFGYRMVDGKIEIVPKESALLQNLFDSYLKGASLKKLAEMAEQTGINYSDSTERWNKNMIARILDDKRYWSKNVFPSIVNEETGMAITAMRTQKATSQCPIKFIQEKSVCGSCGENMIRNSKNTPRIRWNCKKCTFHFGPVTDNALLQSVENKLLEVCRNPQMAEPVQVTGDSLSMQAARLTNEIHQALGQREVDPQRLLPLILECAAEKYKTCRIRESDHITINIKALFQEHGNDEKLDRELFEQTIEQVILQPDGTVQLQLLNGKVV